MINRLGNHFTHTELFLASMSFRYSSAMSTKAAALGDEPHGKRLVISGSVTCTPHVVGLLSAVDAHLDMTTFHCVHSALNTPKEML
jgi:hypothetical protein